MVGASHLFAYKIGKKCRNYLIVHIILVYISLNIIPRQIQDSVSAFALAGNPGIGFVILIWLLKLKLLIFSC